MAETVHATCVSWQGKAALITGRAGAGKSTLGLQLMALGCDLIADDRTVLDISAGQIIASCPSTLAGLMEARGIGILTADAASSAEVHFVIDLDQAEAERLPPRRYTTVLGCNLPLIWRLEGPQFVPAVMQILKSGWSDR